MHTLTMDQAPVKIIGRSYLSDTTLYFALSGSGIAFTFTGKKLSITLEGSEASLLPDKRENHPRIAFYVNQNRVIDDLIDEKEKTYTLLDSEETTTIEVQLIKLSECAMSTIGVKKITYEGDCPTPLPAKKHKIEIIGDSITCGYGVDDENPEHHFTTATEDVTKSYSYKTVSALDADYSMFSISGYGIISGYTDDIHTIHDDQRIPDFYPYVGFSYDTFGGKAPQEIDWDFSKFQPDIVVINLGTNDDSYCQEDKARQEIYAKAYTAFLSQVRKANPDAAIFCVLGLMGSRLFPYIEKACSQFRETTGENKLYTVLLPEQDGNIGYVADYHPMERFHSAAAITLTQALKQYLDSLS